MLRNRELAEIFGTPLYVGRKFVILDVSIDTAGDGPTPFEPPLFAAGDADAAALAGPGRMRDDAPVRDVEVGDVVTVLNVGANDAAARLLLFLNGPAPRKVVIQGGKIVTVSRLQMGRDLCVQLPADALVHLPRMIRSLSACTARMVATSSCR